MLVGTETEYGIVAPAWPDADPHLLSATLVDCCDVPATDPGSDAHNRVLGNGARLYVDHGHPEYSTPECADATDAVTWELAGDEIVRRAADLASERLGARVAVFRNNTDGKGHSYGYHENHLLRRETPFERVVDLLPTFLVTRVIVSGAGRVGLGPAGESPGFQLSQRADYFDRLVSLDTTRNRGIVNTRDEPHAASARWRRLHVIAGDATRLPFATWLKLGSLALFLAALEADELPDVRLADPVAAFRAVSRDTRLAARLPLAEGGGASASDVQRRLLDAVAASPAARAEPEADALVSAWAGVLDDLARAPDLVADRVDWAAKWLLLRRLADRTGAGLDDPRAARLDLAWADLADSSPAAALRRAGHVREVVSPDAVAAATVTPPATTRAWTRGRWVTDHPDAVVAATWDSLLVRDSHGGLHNLRLTSPFAGTVDAYAPAASVDRLIAAHEEGERR